MSLFSCSKNDNCHLSFPGESQLKFLYSEKDKKLKNNLPLHRGAFCQFPFRWIYYCHSSKSTGKETGKIGLYWKSRPVRKSGKFSKSGLSGNRTFSFPDAGLLKLLKIEEKIQKKKFQIFFFKFFFVYFQIHPNKLICPVRLSPMSQIHWVI